VKQALAIKGLLIPENRNVDKQIVATYSEIFCRKNCSKAGYFIIKNIQQLNFN